MLNHQPHLLRPPESPSIRVSSEFSRKIFYFFLCFDFFFLLLKKNYLWAVKIGQIVRVDKEKYLSSVNVSLISGFFSIMLKLDWLNTIFPWSQFNASHNGFDIWYCWEISVVISYKEEAWIWINWTQLYECVII